MFYKKKGTPESGEIVLCTVKKILTHSVFVTIDEYYNLEGLVHISEIAPGRIRNINDYVKIGKRIICKVLKNDKYRGHIDLSLRRVGTGIKLKKSNEIKQEEKSEKLLELMGKKLQKDLKGMYHLFGFKVKEEYGTLHEFYNTVVVEGIEPIKELGVDPKEAKIICEIIQDKISLPEVKLGGELNIQDFNPNGVGEIKEILTKASKDENIRITYLGAPKYKIEITEQYYKSAELILKEVTEKIISSIEKLKGIATFTKDG